MELSWPTALLFDFDGLILDTESSAFHSTAEIYREHGVELDLAEWQAIIGTFDHPHWTDVFAASTGTPIEAAAVIAKRDRRKLDLLAPEIVRPGVTELLEAAATAGVPMAVASSSPAEWVVAPPRRCLGARARWLDLGGTARVLTSPRPWALRYRSRSLAG